VTDFYSLLKQSIVERDIRHPDDRKAVYAQAREAVIKQLWAFRPPLAAHEIDTRIGAYDSAVERIEADLVVTFADGATAERRKPARRAPTPAPPAPTPAPPAPDIPEDEEPAPPISEWRQRDVDDAPPLAGWDEQSTQDEPEVIEFEPGEARDQPPPRYRRAVEQARDEDMPAYADDEEPDESSGGAHGGWWREADAEVARSTAPVASWLALAERNSVQMLAGAITAMVIALAAFGVYFYVARGSDTPTVAIGVRREVSDAATAARIPNDPAAVVQGYTVFDGRDPTIFATTPDNPVHFDATGGFVRVSSSASAPGVRAAIGPGLAARLAGHNVRVIILARSSAELGAATMRFAYQSGVAISHWQTANVGADYEPVGIVWRVPAMRTSPTNDYLVIEPGIPGDGTGVDIRSIRIEVLAEAGS
jgi:hypothetical protein